MPGLRYKFVNLWAETRPLSPNWFETGPGCTAVSFAPVRQGNAAQHRIFSLLLFPVSHKQKGVPRQLAQPVNAQIPWGIWRGRCRAVHSRDGSVGSSLLPASASKREPSSLRPWLPRKLRHCSSLEPAQRRALHGLNQSTGEETWQEGIQVGAEQAAPGGMRLETIVIRAAEPLLAAIFIVDPRIERHLRLQERLRL